jgi:hypothetical protein
VGVYERLGAVPTVVVVLGVAADAIIAYRGSAWCIEFDVRVRAHRQLGINYL